MINRMNSVTPGFKAKVHLENKLQKNESAKIAAEKLEANDDLVIVNIKENPRDSKLLSGVGLELKAIGTDRVIRHIPESKIDLAEDKTNRSLSLGQLILNAYNDGMKELTNNFHRRD